MEDGPSPDLYYRILKKSYICFYIILLILVGYKQQNNNIEHYNKVKGEQQYSRLDIYEMLTMTKGRNKTSKYLYKHVLAGFVELSILLGITWLIGCNRYLSNRVRMKLCLILQKSNAPPSEMNL